MTPLNRRSFLRASFFAACAGTVASPKALSALSARFTRKLTDALPLTTAEETILAFVATYSSNARLMGTGVLEKLRGTTTSECHLLVEIGEVAAFDAAYASRLPFTIGYADGNTFSFELDGVEFLLENLTPSAFAQRTTEIVTLKKIAFAQDALSYNPATQELTDPFGAGTSKLLKMVNRTFAGGAAIEVAVRGRLEAQRLGMKPDGVFASWQASNLGLSTSARSAQAIAEAFLGKLAIIADTNAPDTVKTLLKSRALSTALNRVFGLKVADVIAEFDRLRPQLTGETPNSALWLTILLGPEVESDQADGAARTWLQGGSRFDANRSRKALSEARKLAALPLFQPN